tara:strand:- start:414 stop:668 length:255 start_codon:yes stop_codon:yes gene_type:complete
MIREEDIMSRLQSGKTEIFFKKVDGSIRHMICTLNPSLAPKILEAKGQSSTPGIIAVWDLEKNAWRSFRTESVIYLSEKDHIII